MVTRFAWVGHPSPRPSPRSCLTGRGSRTRFSLRRFRHELSQRLICGRPEQAGRPRSDCMVPAHFPTIARSAARQRWFSAGVPMEMRMNSGNW